jgi:integrase
MTQTRNRRRNQQKGHIFKSSGAWFVRYRVLARQPDGTFKRVQKAQRLADVDSAHRRPSSVRDLADDFLSEIAERTTNPKGTITLADFVEQIYFPNVQEIKRPSTLKADRARWDYQLQPRCGHIALNEFRTSQGQQLMHEIANDPNSKLSQASLRQLKSLMSAIFKHARQQEYMDTANPMRDVIVPRSRQASDDNGNDRNGDTAYYTLDEVKRMVAILPSPAAEIIAIAAFAGLRRGEINGLRWEDYHDGELYISRSWWEGETTDPKTVQSAAPVPVIEPLGALLDAHRERLGNPTSGWMFPASKGEEPVSLNNVRNRLIMPAVKKAGIAWKGYHAFRRGLGTLLYSLGVPDKLIQRILRHSNINVTMTSYVKAVPEDVKQAMKKVEQVLVLKDDATTTSALRKRPEKAGEIGSGRPVFAAVPSKSVQ